MSEGAVSKKNCPFFRILKGQTFFELVLFSKYSCHQNKQMNKRKRGTEDYCMCMKEFACSWYCITCHGAHHNPLPVLFKLMDEKPEQVNILAIGYLPPLTSFF